MTHAATGSPGLLIAVLGAESTGKTALAQALASHLTDLTGRRCTWVSEWLREWCDAQGRTPRADEQAGIATTQHARIQHALASHDIVLADTTALVTAVYSQQVFGDDSLDAMALDLHRRCDATLLTALDIPWQPDPQRDSPAVRELVDARIRRLLARAQLPWQPVQGQGPARVASALAALRPLLRQRGWLRS